MKKQLLFGALLMGSMAASAQTTVWSDNFDDLAITDWMLVDADGDARNWSAVQIQDDEGGPVGTPVLRSASWAQGVGALTPDNWAISPAIDLSAFAEGTSVALNWQVMAVDADWDLEKYTVYVGTGTDTAELMMSELTFTETLGGVNDLTDRTLDLSSFAGQTVYVAFRHYDTSDQFTMEVDNVSVVATTVAGVNSQLASQFAVFPNPATNVINLSNNNNILVNGVEIVDLNGRTVKSVKYDGVSSAQISISDLSSGIYMMNVSSDKGTMTKKIVKN